jgi:hypothetical protein
VHGVQEQQCAEGRIHHLSNSKTLAASTWQGRSLHNMYGGAGGALAGTAAGTDGAMHVVLHVVLHSFAG